MGGSATISKLLPKRWMRKSQEIVPKAAASSADLDLRTWFPGVSNLRAAGGVGSWAGPSSIRWWAGFEFDGFSGLFDSDR